MAQENQVFTSNETARLAYIEDCRRAPVYHDGRPRRPWAALGDVEQDSWIRNPTPRSYRKRES